MLLFITFISPFDVPWWPIWLNVTCHHFNKHCFSFLGPACVIDSFSRVHIDEWVWMDGAGGLMCMPLDVHLCLKLGLYELIHTDAPSLLSSLALPLFNLFILELFCSLVLKPILFISIARGLCITRVK